ncbi:MAG: hypothetical protein E7633_03165 [Ruminococcaceae bacterium]|nr:hypothetical protein [Oscillospiraceae bacterium]
MNIENLPKKIYTGRFRGGHIQGIAIDNERKYIYCSFTTELVKLDMDGNFIGSVKGFTGHLGCLAFDSENNRVYASLEYKNDVIGQGILKRLGYVGEVKNAFYVAIFDPEKIVRPDMSAYENRVMTTVWLRDVVDDYLAEFELGKRNLKHRYGCSGIDGITFAPSFDKKGTDLLVSYGIFGETDREDNDYQVIVAYDPKELVKYEDILSPENIHSSGPESCKEKYFVYTGNTTFGVQNMEYDSYTGDIFLCVYCGKKEKFPNYPLYVIDMKKAPAEKELLGQEGEIGTTLSIKEAGFCENGIYGYTFPHGSTGIASLGDGYFYISEPGADNGEFFSNIYLYRYTGENEMTFVRV